MFVSFICPKVITINNILKHALRTNRFLSKTTKNCITIKQFTETSTVRFYSTGSESITCWKCGAERKNSNEIFCQKCNVLQSPTQSENYFQVFGFNSDYDLDVTALRKKYRTMQSVLHPDKFSNKSDEEKLISADYSSLLNKAFNTLQSPLSRALHLLRLNRVSIGEDDKASDPAFLMEIMELNEEVDDASTPERLKELNLKNNEMLEDLGVDAAKFFHAGDIMKAKEVIVKMKYFASLSKRINDMLREKGITD